MARTRRRSVAKAALAAAVWVAGVLRERRVPPIQVAVEAAAAVRQVRRMLVVLVVRA